MFCNRFAAGDYALGGYGLGGSNFMMMIPILILFLVMGYFVLKAIQGRKMNVAVVETSTQALNILNERFAKGEINEQEYQSIKRQLLQ